jgi:AsmA-like C-terminal region
MSGRFGRSARIVAAAGAALVLLLGLALWGLARSGKLDAWLTTVIAARLDPWLRFSAARAEWWPGLAVVLDDVAVDPRPGAPTQGTAAAAAVTCRVRLVPLLGGRIEIGSVRIDGLQLTVERGDDGTLHAGGLEALAAQSADDDGESSRLFPFTPIVRLHDATIEYRRAGTDSGPPLRLQSVGAQLTPSGDGAGIELTADVDGGGSLRVQSTLDAVDDLATTPYEATIAAEDLDAATLLARLPPVAALSAQGRLRVTATLAGRGSAPIAGDASIELFDGTVTWADWQGVAPIRLAAHVAWDGSALVLSQGTVEAARLSRGDVAAEALAASVTYADRTLQIAAAELRACGGTWRPAGRVTLSEPPQIDASLYAEDVDGAQLADALKAFGVSATLPRLSGPLRLEGHASGTPGGAWSGQASVETDGALTWETTRVGGPIRITADAALESASISLSNGHAQAGRVAAGGVVLDGLDTAFSYTGGALQLAALRCTAFGGAWTYSGSLPVSAATTWRGDLAGTGLDAAALRTTLLNDGGSASGAVDLRAQLTGSGTRAASGTITTRVASPSLTWDGVRIDSPAHVSGGLRLQGNRLSVSNGRARATSIRVDTVAANEIAAAFAYAGARLTVSELEAHAFHGRWRASGAIALGATPTWNGTAQAQTVDFDDLLEAVDPAAGGPYSNAGVADLRVTLNHDAKGATVGSADVTLKAGSFGWDDLHVQAPARANGTFVVRGGTFRLTQAAAQASRASYGPFVGADATANLEYADERLTFADLRFNSCGGTWSHDGWFTLRDGGKFAGQLSVEGAVPSQMAAMLGTRGTDLTFARLDVDSEFSGRAVPDFPAHLLATGTLYMSDGTMRAASVLRPIWQALIGQGQVSEAMARPMTHVQEIGGTFALRQGEIHTTDFSLASDDFNATALGSVRLDGQLDLQARIQVTARGVQKMLVFGSLPLPTSALPGLPPIPAAVTGNLQDPLIRPNVSALPATTVKWLVETLMQTPRSLGEAAAHRLGQFWDGAKRVVGAGQ